MGSFSIWHWLIVGLIVLVLFGGKGKISDIMGDMAKGIKAFKKGMTEDDDAKVSTPVKPLEHTAPTTVSPVVVSPVTVETETRKVG